MPEAASGAIETKTAIRRLYLLFIPGKMVLVLTWRQAKRGTGSSMTRGNFLIDPARAKGGKSLNQPALILTNQLDNEQHFFTPQLNH